jgi:hypothetical protein
VKNIIGFNISWLGLVYLGNGFIPFVLLFLCFHFIKEAKTSREIIFTLTLSSIGILLDSILQIFGILNFAEQAHLPFWLIVLWVCFATTLCHSLTFLASSVWLQVIAGLLAPLSYFAGNKFGAVQFGYPTTLTYAILASLWVLIFISFFALKATFIDQEVNNV